MLLTFGVLAILCFQSVALLSPHTLRVRLQQQRTSVSYVGLRFQLRLQSTSSSAEGEKSAAAEVEARLVIRGESVQGPWYRTMIKRELQMLRKLKGSFYEHEDGKRTEVIVQGTRVRVESFIRWVEQGPQVALRDPITLDKVEYHDKLSPFTGFEIKKIRVKKEDQQK